MESNSQQLGPKKAKAAAVAQCLTAKTPSPPPTRVLLADDHTIVRQGLRSLLNATGLVEVVAEAEDGRKAVALAARSRPDVVVMDVAMPLLNGCEATRQILRAVPSAKVVALSSYTNDEAVFQMVQAGAVGYVFKHTASDQLVDAIQQVRNGSTFFSPAVAQRLPQQGRMGPTRRRDFRLSAREAEVLQLIAEGMVNKEIAWELKISVKTVEKHRQAIMNKLNLHDTAKLTHYAISKAMVECPSPAEI